MNIVIAKVTEYVIPEVTCRESKVTKNERHKLTLPTTKNCTYV